MDRGRLANLLGLLVLVAVVAPFVVYAVPGVIGAEHSFVVVSGSMAPAIDVGDVVVVDDRDSAAIEEGDVITYERAEDESPTTHRVVDVQQREGQVAFRTMGDANDGPDPELVPASNVLGTVVLTIPVIGYVVQFANTPAGFAALLVIPFGLLVATEVWSLARAYRRSNTLDEADGRDRSDGEAADGTDDVAGSDPTETAEASTSVATEPVAESGAAVAESSSDSAAAEPSSDSAVADGTAAVSLHPSDLTATLCLLALAVPYTAYVAVQLPTGLTLSVMFASLFSLVAVGGLWLTEWSSPDPGTDGERERVVESESVPDRVTDGGIRREE